VHSSKQQTDEHSVFTPDSFPRGCDVSTGAQLIPNCVNVGGWAAAADTTIINFLVRPPERSRSSPILESPTQAICLRFDSVRPMTSTSLNRFSRHLRYLI